MFKQNIIIGFLLLLLNTSLWAQKTVIYTHTNSLYNNALELFDKEKFGAAQKAFQEVIENGKNPDAEIIVNSTFYRALCGLELFNKDAEDLLIGFIHQYPHSPKVKWAYYHLGRYKFRRKKYADALSWFNKIDPFELKKEELAEFYFKKGYAYFREDSLEKASNMFFEIKDTDNKYNAPARYYYGHITYLQKKYETALQTFLTLKEHEKFAPVVPYYITQIYYLQGKNKELIEYAPSLLEKATAKRTAEIARLLGEAYYKTEKYSEAIPYLERYHKEKRSQTNRHDKYQLGFAHYKTNNFKEAIGWLKKVTNKEDSLTQVAHYQLAECFLKIGQKKYARTAFYEAYQLDFDPAIQEDALFSFAKLSYELSLHPYNDAIQAFEKFINTYPNSKKLDDAYEFLVTVYFTTKNYKAALFSLENIQKLAPVLQEAYQKIAHYRGIEFFNNRNYKQAINHFNKSNQYPVDKDVKNENMYWHAEANYRLKRYVPAIKTYKSFIFEADAISSERLLKIYYDLGYAYFQLEDYPNANIWFRKYVQNNESQISKIKHDALNRIGDCFFMQKNYNAAIEYYDKGSMMDVYHADYSLYQSALANGIIGNYEDKANLLNTLVHKKEKSHLLDDAIFELGNTKLIKNKNQEALGFFNDIITNYSNSPYVSKSLVKKGLILYNNNEDERSLEALKKVVKDYPSTGEAKEALTTIKKIYIAKGALETYERYLATVGEVDESTRILDTDYYEVAENSYMSGNCEKALADLNNYINKYPNGSFALNAHYYKGNCELKQQAPEAALNSFSYILKRPKNKFTESALLKTAETQKKMGKKEDALNSFNQLEYLADLQANIFQAQVEQMRLAFQLNKYDLVQKYSQLIINKDINDDNLLSEAHVLLGKSALKADDYNLALNEFTTASSAPNKYGVEATYHIAHIQHLRGEFDVCETTIFSLIKNFSSYDYWIGKALILLADNYVEQDDTFQAKATLQNVIEKSEFPELVHSSNEKLSKIVALEEEQNKNDGQENIDLDLPLFDDNELEKLFDQDESLEEINPESDKE